MNNPLFSSLWGKSCMIQRNNLDHYSLQLISTWTNWPFFRQTTNSNAFSWMKMIEFRFEYHWNLFLRVLLITGPNRRQAITWTNADQIHWHRYAALGGDELIYIHLYMCVCVSVCVYILNQLNATPYMVGWIVILKTNPYNPSFFIV